MSPLLVAGLLDADGIEEPVNNKPTAPALLTGPLSAATQVERWFTIEVHDEGVACLIARLTGS
jgi:hypothetical protein